MKKSATATTTATASSFITEARELLRFHFWFGSLRCSFVISKKEDEKTRDHRASSIDPNTFAAYRSPLTVTHGTHVRRTVFVFNFNCFFHHFLPSIGLNSRFVLHSTHCHFAFGQENMVSVKWCRHLTIRRCPVVWKRAYLPCDCLQINCRETIWARQERNLKLRKKKKVETMNTKHRWEMKIIIEVLASTSTSLWTWKTFTVSSETESLLRHANLNTRHRDDTDSDWYLTPGAKRTAIDIY